MNIALIGPTGRLGRAIALELINQKDMRLIGGVMRPGARLNGGDLGVLLGGGMPIGARAHAALDEIAGDADVVIDASVPEMTMRTAESLSAMRNPPALVTGVTGLSPDQEAGLDRAGEKIAVLQAGNFSLGVAVAQALVAEAAALPAESWDVEIAETHHRAKVDAPSGTALMLGRAAARTRGVDLNEAAIWSREGRTGPRPDGAIGFAVSRGGNIIGQHSARFLAEMEEIEITHRAYDRRVFARGALAAARFLAGRAPGRYRMRDVIGL